MYRKAAEERMRRLRKLTRLEELARRVVAAWEEAYEGARQEQHADVALIHRVETVELPAARRDRGGGGRRPEGGRDALAVPRAAMDRRLVPGRHRPLRPAEGREVRAVPDGAARDPAGRRGDRDQPVRAVHRSTASRSRPGAGRCRPSSSSWPGPAPTCRPPRRSGAAATARSSRAASSARKGARCWWTGRSS